MAIADLSGATTRVRRQYEEFPYPHRDPADEANRLRWTAMDELDGLNHYCFGGRRDFRRGFRALVAGGGTGDSTVSLAHQLANTDATVVHLDLSDSSIKIARRRACQRGLEEKITWIQGSLLDLPAAGTEPFDYVNCVGVLHHLDDPARGLAALVSVLKEDGALGLMVYGRYGRTGVYQMQELMRLINHDEDRAPVMLERTRAMLGLLPETNWLKRAPGFLREGTDQTDTELLDTFLHAKDCPFSVLELYDLLDSANLHLIEFVNPNRALYNPRFAFRSESLQRQVGKLPRRHQQAAAELFWGGIDRHEFWASRRRDTIASPRDPDNIPMFSQFAKANKVPQSLLAAVNSTDHQALQTSLKAARDQVTITVKLDLNEVNRQMIRLINAKRTTGEIVQTILNSGCGVSSANEVWQLCSEALESLCMFDFVFLRHASVGGRAGS